MLLIQAFSIPIGSVPSRPPLLVQLAAPPGGPPTATEEADQCKGVAHRRLKPPSSSLAPGLRSFPARTTNIPARSSASAPAPAASMSSTSTPGHPRGNGGLLIVLTSRQRKHTEPEAAGSIFCFSMRLACAARPARSHAASTSALTVGTSYGGPPLACRCCVIFRQHHGPTGSSICLSQRSHRRHPAA